MANFFKKINNNHLIVVASLFVAMIVYFKFLSFGHISWDDPEMVFKNKYVKSFDVGALVTNHFVGNYIPVTMLFHALGWLLFGGNDAGHHLLNVLFHLLNGILVYQLGKQLLKNDLTAVAGMIIFLLHPVQMESVGWISELKNILSTTSYLTAMFYYVIYANAGKNKYYFLSVLFFLIGCFSKSSVVVLPLSLLCVDIYLQKKISPGFLKNKIPFLVLSVIFGLINIKAQTEDLFINYSHAFPYYQRTGYAGFAIARYFFMFLMPVDLSVIYPYPQKATSAFFTGYVVLLCLALLLFYTIKIKKLQYTALILFTLSNLVLVLQFIPFGEVLYADRYMYIPVIGFAWILSSLLSEINAPKGVTVLLLLTSLSFASFSRANVWRSGITLYEDILKKFPNSFVALNSVGVEYMLKDNNEKAFYYLTKSIQVAPYNYKGFYNRGLFYLKNQKPAEAVKNFNQSLNIYEYSKAYVGRASAYHMLGDVTNAVKDAKSALNIEKNNAKAHFVLGNCYNDQNKLTEALGEYNACIRLNDSEPDFYFKRAIVYGKKQEFKNCINDIDLCLSMDPSRYEAYYWRGVAKVNLGQNACEDLKIASENNFQPSISAYNKYCK